MPNFDKNIINKSLDNWANYPLNHTPTKPMLITTGEPAGIGMDIVLDVIDAGDLSEGIWLITADKLAFIARAKALIKAGKLSKIPDFYVIDVPDKIDNITENWLDSQLTDNLKNQSRNHPLVIVLNIICRDEVIAGQLNTANAAMVERQLHLAHMLAKTHQIRAIITAPLQKSVMIQAGICLDNGDIFSGHTEYFMHKSNCHKVVMMLANRVMKVALVTTHLPLKDVAYAITANEIKQTVRITHQGLVTQFGILSPKILVCGLNPHAGEDGHLGDEEICIINPALEALMAEGINISYAMPADTLFTPQHLADCDAVIAMYHDQGLAPLKSHGFGDTVNITLGLPYVRTSVDHGTALDLAGTGRASSSSLKQAIFYANKMSLSGFDFA